MLAILDDVLDAVDHRERANEPTQREEERAKRYVRFHRGIAVLDRRR